MNLQLSSSEQIRLILKRKNMTMGDLADATGQSRQNLSNKLSRGNFSEKDLHAIAKALGCRLEVQFVELSEREE